MQSCPHISPYLGMRAARIVPHALPPAEQPSRRVFVGCAMPTMPPRHRPPGMPTREQAERQRKAKKAVDPYYLTPEHRAWATAVIQRAGGKCQDPTCRALHYPGQRLFADHIKERRDRPDLALDLRNGRAVCGSAHSRKTAAERARRLRDRAGA